MEYFPNSDFDNLYYSVKEFSTAYRNQKRSSAGGRRSSKENSEATKKNAMEDVFQDLTRLQETRPLYKQLKGLSDTNSNDVKAVKRVTQAIVRVLNPTDPFGMEEDEPEDTPTGRVKEDDAGEERPYDVVSQEEAK